MDLDTKILIVGAGAFGTSTAYHLSLRGYRSIRVLDRYPAPSIEAASTDISKIIRSDYNEPLYAKMGIEAIKAWRDWDMFRGLYQVPGWILSAMNLSVPFVKSSIKVSEKLGVQGLEEMSPEQIRRRWPILTGRFDGWNINVWNPTAGWANAGEALNRMALAAQKNGVEYISGDRGYVRKMLCSNGKCHGVQTKDGSTHTADLVIMAAGAWTPSVLDLEGQLTAKGHAVAHIQMSPSETQTYSSMPIMDSLELGYFFPPQADGIFKMAHSQFITNTVVDSNSGITTSVPHTFHESPSDDLPLEVEATMRRNLQRILPELSQRPFCFTRLCWDADTADRHFLVTPHPTYQGLFLACGGSAHGFKFFPILGKYIVDHLEGKLDPSIVHNWRWRAGEDPGKKDLAHLDPELELRELTGWKSRKSRENGEMARL